MSAKHSRSSRVGLERLERRETPSGASATAAAANVVGIGSTGIAIVSRSQPIVNGQRVVTTLAGTSKGIGRYTAELSIFYGLGSNLGSGTGVVTTASGDTINLNLRSSIGIPTRPTGHRGVIDFVAKGGTGAFASATGHGRLTGNVNFIFNFPYTVSGRIRK